MLNTIHNLLSGLKSTPGILSSLAASIPTDRLHVRRGKGFWTIAENIDHLAEVQPMLLDRLKRFANEEHPVFVPYLPDKDEIKVKTAPPRPDIGAALVRFAEVRDLQLDLLATLAEPIWQRRATHPEYELYSLAILVRHIFMHDHWHMYRMEELWLTRDAYLTRLG